MLTLSNNEKPTRKNSNAYQPVEELHELNRVTEQSLEHVMSNSVRKDEPMTESFLRPANENPLVESALIHQDDSYVLNPFSS